MTTRRGRQPAGFTTAEGIAIPSPQEAVRVVSMLHDEMEFYAEEIGTGRLDAAQHDRIAAAAAVADTALKETNQLVRRLGQLMAEDRKAGRQIQAEHDRALRQTLQYAAVLEKQMVDAYKQVIRQAESSVDRQMESMRKSMLEVAEEAGEALGDEAYERIVSASTGFAQPWHRLLKETERTFGGLLGRRPADVRTVSSGARVSRSAAAAEAAQSGTQTAAQGSRGPRPHWAGGSAGGGAAGAGGAGAAGAGGAGGGTTGAGGGTTGGGGSVPTPGDTPAPTRARAEPVTLKPRSFDATPEQLNEVLAGMIDDIGIGTDKWLNKMLEVEKKAKATEDVRAKALQLRTENEKKNAATVKFEEETGEAIRRAREEAMVGIASTLMAARTQAQFTSGAMQGPVPIPDYGPWPSSRLHAVIPQGPQSRWSRWMQAIGMETPAAPQFRPAPRRSDPAYAIGAAPVREDIGPRPVRQADVLTRPVRPDDLERPRPGVRPAEVHMGALLNAPSILDRAKEGKLAGDMARMAEQLNQRRVTLINRYEAALRYENLQQEGEQLSFRDWNEMQRLDTEFPPKEASGRGRRRTPGGAERAGYGRRGSPEFEEVSRQKAEARELHGIHDKRVGEEKDLNQLQDDIRREGMKAQTEFTRVSNQQTQNQYRADNEMRSAKIESQKASEREARAVYDRETGARDAAYKEQLNAYNKEHAANDEKYSQDMDAWKREKERIDREFKQKESAHREAQQAARQRFEDDRDQSAEERRQAKEDHKQRVALGRQRMEQLNLFGSVTSAIGKASLAAAAAVSVLGNKFAAFIVRLDAAAASSKMTTAEIHQMATGFEALTGIQTAASDLEQFERAQRAVTAGMRFGEPPTRRQILAYSHLGIALGEQVEMNETLYNRMMAMDLATREYVGAVTGVAPAIMQAQAADISYQQAMAMGIEMKEEDIKKGKEQALQYLALKKEMRELATRVGPEFVEITKTLFAVALPVAEIFKELVTRFPKLTAGLIVAGAAMVGIMPIMKMFAMLKVALTAPFPLNLIAIGGALAGGAIVAGLAIGLGNKMEKSIEEAMVRANERTAGSTARSVEEGTKKAQAEIEREKLAAEARAKGLYGNMSAKDVFYLGASRDHMMPHILTGDPRFNPLVGMDIADESLVEPSYGKGYQAGLPPTASQLRNQARARGQAAWKAREQAIWQGIVDYSDKWSGQSRWETGVMPGPPEVKNFNFYGDTFFSDEVRDMFGVFSGTEDEISNAGRH